MKVLDARMRVLLIADDRTTCTGITTALAGAGLDVRAHAGGREALDASAEEWRPDVVVIDLLLSTYETYVACRSIRSAYGVPVIIVTPHLNRLGDIVDCALPRPVVVDDLLRAIESLVQGTYADDAVIHLGDCVLMLRAGLLHAGGTRVPVSRDELALLTVLSAPIGRPVRRNELRAALTGMAADTDPRVVDIHLMRLMVKLEATCGLRLRRTPANDAYVLTIASQSQLAASA